MLIAPIIPYILLHVAACTAHIGTCKAAPMTAVTTSVESAGLYTDGSRTKIHDGHIWQGRGANLQDTRSCDSCLVHPDVGEVLRRIDALINHCHENSFPLTMETYFSFRGDRRCPIPQRLPPSWTT